MREQVDEFVRLRCETLARTPGFVAGDAARDRLASHYQRARSFGLVHELVHVPGPRAAGRAIAQLMFFRDPDAWFGGPVVLGWIDRDRSRPESLGPVLAAIDRHRDRLGSETLLEVAVDDGPLLAGLVARGFGIDSVVQVGDPKVALASLESAGLPDPDLLARTGSRLVPLAETHVAEVVELHRRVFSAEPAWCWFGAHARHLERVSRGLRAHPMGQFVVLTGEAGVVTGHLGAELDDNPYWGRMGGFELVLDRALRGRGLGRILYRVALESLVLRGAVLMKGGTSQPGVMALGRVMQRPWHAFNLRRQTAFSPAHFLRFAPEPIRLAHAPTASL